MVELEKLLEQSFSNFRVCTNHLDILLEIQVLIQLIWVEPEIFLTRAQGDASAPG